MILVRKLRSAVRLYRHGGLSTVAESAWDQSRDYIEANAILPPSDRQKAALLNRIFNDRPEYSYVALDENDVRACRPALLYPYLRRQFFDVIGSVPDLRQLKEAELPLMADSLFRRWEFSRLDAARPEWRRRLSGTKFAPAFDQMSRRVALRLGRLSEAGDGLKLSGGDVADCLLRAEVLDAQGKLPEAAKAFEEAVRRHSHESVIRLHYAFHLLKTGRWKEGLENWGLAEALLGTYPLRKRRRRWAGEDLDGRTLLVIFEHGLGDMIQFSRFLHPLRAAQPGAAVIGRVPRPLVGLLQQSFPDVSFVAAEDEEPPYDFYIPSLQLPLIVEATSLLPDTGYLRLGEPPRDHGASRRKRVGVCWRGHPRQYELTRSIPLQTFARLFERRDVDFVVLLNTLTDQEANVLTQFAHVQRPPIGDFVDLGALVASCDLVVSVDTAVAHVSGAAGKPTLLLSRPDACWRWGSSGRRSPWYETVEVLRHPGDMDWAHVLAEASRRLDGQFSPPMEAMASSGA